MVHNCLLNLLNNTAVLCEVPYISKLTDMSSQIVLLHGT